LQHHVSGSKTASWVFSAWKVTWLSESKWKKVFVIGNVKKKPDITNKFPHWNNVLSTDFSFQHMALLFTTLKAIWFSDVTILAFS